MPIANIAKHKIYVAQSLLYVTGVGRGCGTSQRPLRALKVLVCEAGKDSAFIGSGIDPYQEIECSIQYTLSRNLPIAASRAAHGKAGTKNEKR